ncbi:MAG: ATP synthase subunit C [Candidatus Bipolaricaulia bacterium]
MRKIVYGLLGFNLLLLLAGLALFGFSLVVYHPWAAAQEAPAGEAVQPPEKGVGAGLGLLGAALATIGSTVGAGWALAHVGTAALGAITEKPELFGRSLVYVGLAEGIAIYGIIISIMILGKL